MGTSPNSPIQVNKDLTKKKGDSITFNLVAKLSGNGQTGDNTLEGNEEALNVYTQAVEIDQIRNAVKLEGRMTEKRAAINMRNAAKWALQEWIAEHLVSAWYTAMTTSPTTNRIVYAGTSNAAEADVASTDIPSIDEISVVKAMAQTGNGDASPKVRPIKIENGEEYYILMMETHAARELKNTSNYRTVVGNLPRSTKHPIFTGAMAVIDGVIIKSDPNVPTALTGTSSCRLARNVLLGAQSSFVAWGQTARTVERDFDYDNQTGFAVGEIRGVEKAVFNSEDHGCVNYISSAPLT